MTLSDFRSLSPAMQFGVVKQAGVFLLARTGVGITAKLYQVNSFYAEVYYDSTARKVVQLVAFEETAKLDRYLPLINLSELRTLLGR